MEWKESSSDKDGHLKIPARWVHSYYYEAFNLLFRIENSLRVFVYILLKDASKSAWAATHVIADDKDGTIDSLSKRRVTQSQAFGYLGFEVQCPIMHLTSGEITRLMTSDAHWETFKKHFRGSREIIRTKFEEIGSIRNALAHFRPIKVDDVSVIKQNAKQTLGGVETFLRQALVQEDVVPTNTAEDWYRELRTIGTAQCTLSFSQSDDGAWIRISIGYKCPIVSRNHLMTSWVSYQVLTIDSPSILSHSLIRENAIFLAEYVPYTTKEGDEDPNFRKVVDLVFSRSTLAKEHNSIKTELESVLSEVSSETELILKDNLARGTTVRSTSAFASGEVKDGKMRWSVQTSTLLSPVNPLHPVEYWGNITFSSYRDFIAASERYPWMPEGISEPDLPF